MKPAEIAKWLEEVKTKAVELQGDGYDRTTLECRRIADRHDEVMFVAYFPDGEIRRLIMPVRG